MWYTASCLSCPAFTLSFLEEDARDGHALEHALANTHRVSLSQQLSKPLENPPPGIEGVALGYVMTGIIP